jgi:hypothetical protein
MANDKNDTEGVLILFGLGAVFLAAPVLAVVSGGAALAPAVVGNLAVIAGAACGEKNDDDDGSGGSDIPCS